MTLEAASFISSLNSSAPGASDPRNQGDDHLRLIKAVLQATFPNASGPFYIPTSISAQTSAVSVATPTDGGKTIPVDASAGAVTVTLPSDVPFDGFFVKIVKSDFSINQVTISGNGRNINGVSTIKLIKGFHTAILEYSSALSAWIAYVSPAIMPGTFVDNPSNSIPGHYLCDGLSTIGDGSSGATNAGAENLGLFQVLWNQFSNTVCPVSGGRGSTASADFAAHKKLTLPDLRGRARFGKDNMGGVAANRITSAVTIDGTVMGQSGGSQSVTLTQANLPNVTLAVTISGTCTGTFSGTTASVVTSTNRTTGDIDHGGGETICQSDNKAAVSCSGTITGTISGSVNTASINGNTTQTAVDILPPAFITNVFVAM